jgi:hypothetical protein
MRYAARIDANKAQIVEALRLRGAYVWDLKLPVDLLVGHNGRTCLVEIKRDEKAKLTGLQRLFFSEWKGGALVRIDSPEAAIQLLKVMES